MGLRSVGGWLLACGLVLQPAGAGSTTVLLLANREAPLAGVWGSQPPPPEFRSAPVTTVTRAGETLYGLLAATPPRDVPAARNGAALAELCRQDRLAVVVAIGGDAAQAAARECAVPLLVVQTPRQQVVPLLADPPRRGISAIYLEAEPALNLRVLRALLPAAGTVGVFVPASAPAWLPPLRAEAQRLQLTLEELTVTDDLDTVRALRPRLASLDAVLLPPEPALINEWSLKPLLLMTIRQGIPVFGGLTARYVEAGVLAAVVADADRLPAQLQAALAELARGQVPAPAYPAASRVVVNPTVAHSLAVPAAALERSRSVSLQAVDP